MKYTFVNNSGNEQTIDIPEEFIMRTRRALGCDVREACELYLSDEGYVDNEVVQELNEKAGAQKTRKGPVRKPDPIKRAMIEYLRQSVETADVVAADGTNISCENIEVTNPERVVRFQISDDIYEITLSRKRKPKA